MKTIRKKYLLMLALVFGIILSLVFACVFSLKTGNTDTAASTYNKETGVPATAAVAFDHEFWVYGTATNNITLDYMSGTGGTRTTQGTGYTPATCMTNLEAIRLNAPNSAIHFSEDAAGAGTLTVTTAFTFAAGTSGDVYIDGNLATTTANINLITNSGTINLFITDGTISATTGRTINNGSTGEVNISGGTISATTGPAIHNASTGKITISQPTTTPTIIRSANVTSASGTIYLAAGTAGQSILDIRGGTIENTANNANARSITNAGVGTVDISGGTVSANTGPAIHNASTGKITISQPTATDTKLTSKNLTLTSGTICLGSAAAGTLVLDIQGGLIENTGTADSGRAIYNSSAGTINISGGVVAVYASSSAIVNNTTGAINISGGTVSANTAAAIYNISTGRITISQPTATDTKLTSKNISSGSGVICLAGGTAGVTILDIQGGIIENTETDANVRVINNTKAGTINISGGMILADAGRAIHNNSTGALNISGGTILANTGATVFNASTGKITISQPTATPTIITSANVTATSGTIHLTNVAAGTTVLEIQDGTIENTAAGGNAIYKAGTNSNKIILSGTPDISGHIAVPRNNCLSTAADFNPGWNIYTIFFTATPAANDLIVVDGALFLSNFTVSNSGWELTVSGNNLVLQVPKQAQAAFTITSAASVNFGNPYTVTSTGGSGTGAVTYAVVAGGTGAATVNATTGVLTVISTGTIFLEATKAGDTNYLPTTSPLFTLTVNSGNQASFTITSAASVNFGNPYIVTSTGGSGTGAVTYAVVAGGTGTATINAVTGVLTITSAGTIFLEATKAGDTNYNPITATLTLTVNKANQAAFTITSSSSVNFGNPYTVTSAGGSGTGAVTYAIVSGGTGVATVNATTGVLTVTTAGTIFLEATKAGDADYNPITASLTLTVNKANQAAFTITSAASVSLSTPYTVTSAGGSGSGAVTYAVVAGGTGAATVNPTTGVLTITSAGTIFLEATKAGDTNYNPITSPTFTLTVTNTHTVTIINSGSHGNISGGGSYSAGDPVTLAVTVTDIGWEFDKWISTDITISAGDETKLTLTFTMPSGNVSVTALYKKTQYSLTADVNDTSMGSLSGSASGNYEFGDSISVTATAKIGYKFVQWNVTGVTLNDITNPVAMFNMPANAITLTAVFAADMRNVTVVSPYGTVTGAGSKQAGSVVTLTLSNIAAGWDYSDWTLTGASATVKNNTTLSFIMPANDVNVTVVFTQTEYNLNVSVNNAAFGSISSTAGVIIGTNQKFYYNDNIDITAIPASGYRFVRWSVTGAAGDGSTVLTLTFTMPTNTVTVQAVFQADNGTVTVTQSPGTYGTVTGDGVHTVGSTVTLILSGITPGWEFDSWGIPASVTNITVNNSTTLEFEMPATGVNITLNFKKIGYQLTVTVNDISMGGVSLGGGTYEVGDFVSIQATAFAGYVFKKWVVTGNATGNNSTNPNLTFNMPAGNVAVEAVFEAKGFNVNVISAQGTVSGGGNALYGSTVTLTVDSINAGWEFDRWDYTGITPTTENNTTLVFTMPNGDITVTAVYKKIQYILTANVNDNTMGEVIDTALPPNVITGGSYTIGEQVVIAARALPGYEFLGWQGIGSLPGLQQNGTQIKFLMPAGNVTITAIFGVSQLTVTVTSPDGSISGNNGTYTVGDTVTITAVPNSGYRFTGWTSADITITGADITNPTLTFTMPGYDVLIIAAYDGISYNVTADIDPIGGGTVSGGGLYKTGETVNLAATPATGYKFSHWASTDIVILNPVSANITFTMPAGNVTVTAFFVPEDYTITIISPNGTVSGNTGSFNYNDPVTLTITAQAGYKITGISCTDPGVNLSGAVLGGGTATVTFNMPANDITVNVKYELIEYTITIISQNGTVLGASGMFTVGESVSLAAYADIGYAFGNWSSADITIAVDTDSIITFNMPAKDITITALFIKEDYSVTVITPFGYVTGNANTFNAGDTVTLTLTLQGGYTFLGWSSLDVPTVDGSVSLVITFTMPAQNVTITALFDVILYDLIVISSNGTVSGGKAQYAFGEQVSITASPDIGYVFDRWESNDIVINNPNSVTLTFLMPENNVTVTAVYRLASYILTVDAGLGNVTGNNGSYNGGDMVNLTAIDTPGRTFDHWESNDIVINNPANSSLTFGMPFHNVTVKAVFIAEGFTVTVTSYYGSIRFDNVFTITGSDYISIYEAGESVNIIATALPGYKFVRYISSEVAFKLPPIEDDTFIMPAKNVNITAIYIESIEVKLTGTEYCEVEGEGQYKSGDYVSITVTPKPGYRLIGWESDDIQISTTPVNPNIMMLSLMSVRAVSVTLMPSYTIYFLMPSYSVYITPIFEAVEIEDFELDKESGSGAAGDQIQLNPIFTPGDAVGEIVWKSSDTSVATVDENGLVTIVGIGTAIITATCGSTVRHFIVIGEAPDKIPDLLWLWILLGVLALLLLILIIFLIARKKRAPISPDEKPDKKEKPDNSNERSIGTNERPAHIEEKPINITISNVLNNSGEGNSNSGKDSGQPFPAAAKDSAVDNDAKEAELNRIVPDMATDKTESAADTGADAQLETKPAKKGNSSAAGQPINAPQIHIDPYASSEQIDKIFESMSKHLYGKDKDKE